MEASRLPIADEQIDKHAVIDCPMNNFRATRSKNYCPECSYFKGVVDLIPNQIEVAKKLQVQGKSLNDLPWDSRFAIKCAYPIERKVNCIEVIE